MGAGEIRVIRRRVKTIQSTMKITKAFELIATSRIVKAEQRVSAARPYATQMATVTGNLAKAAGGDVQHPLLDPREEIRRSAVLVICGDRGLSGAYNANVLRTANRTLADQTADDKAVIAIGRKAQGYFKYRGAQVMRVFMGMGDQPRYDDAREVGDWLIGQYLDGEVDKVDLVYTAYVNAARQEVRSVPLLPLDPTALIGEGEGEDHEAETSSPAGVAADTIFEPDPAEILGDLIPKGVVSRIYSALLESSASEHAERRRAMKSATDNARDLIKVLQIQGNKARQAAITTEILEVVGGAEALAASGKD